MYLNSRSQHPIYRFCPSTSIMQDIDLHRSLLQTLSFFFFCLSVCLSACQSLLMTSMDNYVYGRNLKDQGEIKKMSLYVCLSCLLCLYLGIFGTVIDETWLTLEGRSK